MLNFSFILTEKCDWGCEYCYFPNLSKQKGPTLETFQKHLPYIKEIIDKLEFVNIDIQGGEIGTIPIEILEYFCETIDRKISFSTNGLFLIRKMHLNEKIRPYIGLVMWHIWNFKESGVNELVLSEFAGNAEEEYILQDIPISRGITHNNIDEIYNVIQANPNVIFDYVELEFDIKYPRKVNFIMYHELLNRIENLPNLTDNAKEILYRRLSEPKDHRDNCMKYNHSIVFDMINETICLCQRQPDVYISLTKENLWYRLITFPKDVFKGNCESCTRLYSGKPYGIETFFRTRRILS